MSYPLIDICFVYRGRSSGISFQCVGLNELNFDNHTKQSISRNKRVLWCFSHIMRVNFTGTQTTKCLQSVHSLCRERVWIGSKHTQTLWCWVRLTNQVLEPYVCVSLCKVEHCSWVQLRCQGCSWFFKGRWKCWDAVSARWETCV